jgi:hypothetical protein
MYIECAVFFHCTREINQWKFIQIERPRRQLKRTIAECSIPRNQFAQEVKHSLSDLENTLQCCIRVRTAEE